MKTATNAICYQPKLKLIETGELIVLSSCYLPVLYLHFNAFSGPSA